jgi:hypothetical protein
MFNPIGSQIPFNPYAPAQSDELQIIRSLLREIRRNGGDRQLTSQLLRGTRPAMDAFGGIGQLPFDCGPSFGAPFMGVPFQNCLPPSFLDCFPNAAAFAGCAPQPICAPICAPLPFCAPQPAPQAAPAPAPQPAPQAAPPPPPAPSKIKKGKEWKQGMVDASGKDIPKPPRQGSNAHFDKDGNFKKWTSPLTFDLNGNGKVGTTDIANGKKIDIDGDGKIDNAAWAEKGDGVLAFDADGDGVAGKSGKELFGNATDLGDGRRHANGFEALKALAVKKLGAESIADGKLDARELAALERSTAEGGAGLRMMVDGRQVKPSELGMSQIDVGYKEAGENADENGNQHRQVGAGFVRNGQRGKVDDVWFQHA